jgi:formylglycine-generating enzyme required for sulfatase activity/serine/threonine protein kinase
MNIGKWIIDRNLGAGSMGTVYLAHAAKVASQVRALKVVHPELAKDEQFRKRFFAEFETLESLRHPNILLVHDCLEEEDSLVLVSEFLVGRTLKEELEAAGGGLPWEGVCEWARHALSALEYAHAKNIIHRDIKPSNLFLCADGTVKVIDFGLAKRLGDTAASLSLAGQLVGTPAYMAPELAKQKPHPGSDVYALGATMHHLLTGKLPFDTSSSEGDPVLAMFMAHWSETPPDLRQAVPGIPESLVAVVEKAMEKEPLARFASATEVARALEAVKDGPRHVDPTATVLHLPTFGDAPTKRTAAVVEKVKPAPESGAEANPPPAAGPGPTDSILHLPAVEVESARPVDDAPIKPVTPVSAKRVERVSARGPTESILHLPTLDGPTVEAAGAAKKEKPRPPALDQPTVEVALGAKKEKPRLPAPMPSRGKRRWPFWLATAFAVCAVVALAVFVWPTGREEPTGAVSTSPTLGAASGKKASANAKESPTIGYKFVEIPAGSFQMGSSASEPGREDDEKQHQVTISKAFLLGATEVTQGQWQRMMGRNPSYFKNCGDDCPVENVSWNDAVDFCNKLSDREGLTRCYDGAEWNRSCTGYRLPTEAEWEYAARAGTTTAFNMGKCLSTDQANYEGNYPQEGCPKGQYREKPVRVGSFSANSWGLYDMLGNVWELTWDWYGSYPSGSVTDPTGASGGSVRVYRGGGWINVARGCRSANRNVVVPGDRFNILGFRLSRSVR